MKAGPPAARRRCHQPARCSSIGTPRRGEQVGRSVRVTVVPVIRKLTAAGACYLAAVAVSTSARPRPRRSRIARARQNGPHHTVVRHHTTAPRHRRSPPSHRRRATVPSSAARSWCRSTREPEGPTFRSGDAAPVKVPDARIGRSSSTRRTEMSRIDDIANGLGSLTPQLLADFDLVSSTTGVERSDPLTCGRSRSPRPRSLTGADDASRRRSPSRGEAVRRPCRRPAPTSSPMRIDDAARDMNKLHAALGKAASPTWASPTARCSG